MAANHAGRGDTSESADCQLAKVEKSVPCLIDIEFVICNLILDDDEN